MDITFLPEPVFIHIMRYLMPDDLLSCSLVNLSWRNAINCNDIWRFVCMNRLVSITGKELDHLPMDVPNCEFTSLDSEASSFEPLCNWRKTFMRWFKLEGNWRKGYYKRFYLDEVISVISDEYIECDDNVALIINDCFREISVWNIKRVPYRQEKIQFLLLHVCSDYVKLCNNYLVIVQCNLLQVFFNSENGFVLRFKCIFDRDESFMKMLPASNMTEWYCVNITLYPCDLLLRCAQNGSKFVGLILGSNNDENILHVWDLNNNTKDCEAPVPQSSNVSDIHFSIKNDYVFLMIKYKTNQFDSFYIFDLKLHKFIDFKMHFEKNAIAAFIVAVIIDKHLIVSIGKDQTHINICESNGKSNKVINCNYEISLKCFNVVIPYILVGGRNVNEHSKTTLNMYHIQNLDNIFTMNVSYPVKFMSLIQNKFLIIEGVSVYPFITVVDVIKRCSLYVIENSDCIYINSIHSKLVIRDDCKLSLLSFW